MRKTLITMLLVFLSVVLVYGYADAKVSGACADCHTMHASQDGVAGTPIDSLLKNNCIGCHTTATSDPLDGNYPRVRSTSSGFNNDNSLAGGFFAATDSTGSHDDTAHSLGSTFAPAGYSGSWYTGTSEGLSCAGTNGCHGNVTTSNDMEAIKGGHHNPSAYRILFVGVDEVLGAGALDFEKALIIGATDGVAGLAHNTYSAGGTNPSISELCAKCHSDFHGGANTGDPSPWERHPTDVAIDSTWTISSASLDEFDWKYNPLGYDDADDTGTREVICVSCHRAHGSAENDNLRFDYTLQDAAGGYVAGCLACHNKQQ